MAVAFVAVQCEICLVVKFVTGQGVLFLVVPCIAELYRELCLAGSVVTVKGGLFRVASFIAVQCGLCWAVSFVTVQCELHWAVSDSVFVTVQYGLFSGGVIYYCAVWAVFWRRHLLLCSMSCFWWCHLLLCNVGYILSYVEQCHLLLCNVGRFGRRHLLPCNVGWFLGGVVCYRVM